MQDTIRVCDAEKYYGNKNHVTKAVDRVSFTVQQGEFIGVMGASGYLQKAVSGACCFSERKR